VETTIGSIRERGIRNLDDVLSSDEPVASFSGEVAGSYGELKTFLMKRMYRHYRVLRMQTKAERIIRELFSAYVANIETIPPEVRIAMAGESPHKIACDYIAGMTDRFALDEYRRLFDPYTRV
jgi:dGTPase